MATYRFKYTGWQTRDVGKDKYLYIDFCASTLKRRALCTGARCLRGDRFRVFWGTLFGEDILHYYTARYEILGQQVLECNYYRFCTL